MQYLAENMMGRTFCPLGDAAAMPTIGFITKFRKEFEDHLEGRKPPTDARGAQFDWSGTLKLSRAENCCTNRDSICRILRRDDPLEQSAPKC